jgi:hypothetical protein
MLSVGLQLVVKPMLSPVGKYSILPPPWPNGTAGTEHMHAVEDVGQSEMLDAVFDLW